MQRREAERRLVEKQEARAGHQRAADRDHLLLAARERARRLPPPLAQRREHRVHAREAVRARRARPRRVAAELEVLLHRHAGEEPAPLGHDRDARARDLVRREPGEVLAAETEPPGRETRRSPAIALMSVVLPLPLGPTTDTSSRDSHGSETSQRAVASP